MRSAVRLGRTLHNATRATPETQRKFGFTPPLGDGFKLGGLAGQAEEDSPSRSENAFARTSQVLLQPDAALTLRSLNHSVVH